jgi:hypothetical protein
VASSRTRGPGWAVPVFFGFLSWSRWSCGFLSTAGRGPASGQGSAVAWWLGQGHGPGARMCGEAGDVGGLDGAVLEA